MYALENLANISRRVESASKRPEGMADNVYILACIHVFSYRSCVNSIKKISYCTRSLYRSLYRARCTWQLDSFNFHHNLHNCNLAASRTMPYIKFALHLLILSVAGLARDSARSFAHVIRMQTFRGNPVRGTQADGRAQICQ